MFPKAESVYLTAHSGSLLNNSPRPPESPKADSIFIYHPTRSTQRLTVFTSLSVWIHAEQLTTTCNNLFPKADSVYLTAPSGSLLSNSPRPPESSKADSIYLTVHLDCLLSNSPRPPNSPMADSIYISAHLDSLLSNSSRHPDTACSQRVTVFTSLSIWVPC